MKDPQATQQSKKTSSNEGFSLSRWKTSLKKLTEWPSKYGEHVQTWSTVIQAGTALLMLITLVLGWQALSLSQRQFESTIEPMLEISSSALQVLNTNFNSKVVTNDYLGIPIKNVATNLDVTNSIETTFKNIGCVSISRLELFMWIEIVFDEHQKASDFIYSKTSHLLAKKLSPDQSVNYCFGNEPSLQNLLKMNRQERKGRALFFVIRFQRGVDMMTRYKMVMVETFSSSPDDQHVFAMPIDNSFDYISHAKKGDVPESYKRKTEAKEILKRLDILVSDN